MIECPERVNIAAYLPEMASTRPHQMAVAFPHGKDSSGRVAYTHLTFAQLDEDSDRLASGFLQLGFTQGMRTVLMVKPSLDFFSLTFALFKLGSVPIFIDPGMGLKNLKACLRDSEPEAFIGIAKAHLARIIFRWPKVKLRVGVGRTVPFGGYPLSRVRLLGKGAAFSMQVPKRGETAAILFTSGSTGPPKGVVYSHGVFDAQVRMLKEMYAIQPGEIDLCTFPLFALFAPALGMTAVVPEMDFTKPAHVNPENIFSALNSFGCTNMFGSPALLRRVGQWAMGKRVSAHSLRRVISAGAPVQGSILQQFTELLAPGVEVFTPYGATESLPVCSIGSQEILTETVSLTAQGKGICVGRPAPGVQVHILEITESPIPDLERAKLLKCGEIGEILVTSPSVTCAYFQKESATALAKIKAADGTVYHRMGDLGYFDSEGRVWFCGRKAHRVTTLNGMLFTVPIEGIFNQHPKVFRTALVGIGPSDAQTPVLCVELETTGFSQKQKILDELKQLAGVHSQTKEIKQFLIHPGFPVDIRHNAKIFREKLQVWAAKKLSIT